MRRIDLNGDGTFEETQNFVTDRQGSVVGVLGAAVPVDVNNEAAGMKPGEVIARVRYDTYGVPTICDPADIDRDGVVDFVDAAMYVDYWKKWKLGNPSSTRYKEIADFDRDGVVDPDGTAVDGPSGNNADYAEFLVKYAAATLPNAETAAEKVGNLPLYAGYWWDSQLEMYHVRHRVYRPEWGKWIQRDPLGYAAGWNLYEYVGGEPWRGIDPLGLFGWDDVKSIGFGLWEGTKEVFRQIGRRARQLKDGVTAVVTTVVVHLMYMTGNATHDQMMKGSPIYRLFYEAAAQDENVLVYLYNSLVDAAADSMFRMGQGDTEAISDAAFTVFEATVPFSAAKLLRGSRVVKSVVPKSADGGCAKEAISKNYRDTFFKEHPELKDKVVVHHSIEQQVAKKLYPTEFSVEELNALEHLRGIPKNINSKLHLSELRKEWNRFYKENPNATRDQIITERNRIDWKYGRQFSPPVGGE